MVVRLFGRPGRHVSGPEGTLSLDIPPGRYAFTTWKAGYATVKGSLPVGTAGEFTVSMYRLDDVELGIPARLVVRVGEYGSGRPIEGAVVSLQGGGVRQSDARGMAEFTDLREPVAELSVGMFRICAADRAGIAAVGANDHGAIGHDRGGHRTGTPRGGGALTVSWKRAACTGGSITAGCKHLLTREHLDTLSSISDALDRMSGMRVEYSGGLPYVTGRRRCPLRMFLDGFPLFLDSV